jgi:hypothetical protein
MKQSQTGVRSRGLRRGLRNHAMHNIAIWIKEQIPQSSTVHVCKHNLP